MKRWTVRAALWTVLGSALASCSLIELPFKLLGFLLQGIFQLLGALINVGSSAAMQVAKLTPIAMLFTQASPEPVRNLDAPAAMEQLAQAFENAPTEVLRWEEAAALESAAGAENSFLFDPAELLSEAGKAKISQALAGREILGVRWVCRENPATSASLPSPEASRPSPDLSSR